MFIWLGDNIYADVKEPNKFFGKKRTVGPFKNVPRFWPITPEEMKEKYNLMKTQQLGYVALQNKAQVLLITNFQSVVYLLCKLLYQF